ncbi:PREDICTED: uncharacterized protein LOC106917907 isoform X2 [Poecilia mexicana]|uniref:uncharacterized protein LOC106917907 isoform X2 n=1 Tax=Poecilia mexicana TaxID=48701 RepID=UPI00072DDA35|nr:PREDICTED: uncharacterized protein LOC106917907 isoform X2 [Poecilia mexicana]
MEPSKPTKKKTRRFCGHCDNELSQSQYFHHKKLYFSNGVWNRNRKSSDAQNKPWRFTDLTNDMVGEVESDGKIEKLTEEFEESEEMQLPTTVDDSPPYAEPQPPCFVEGTLGIPANSKPADCKTLLSFISGLSCLVTQLSENLYHRLGSMDEKFLSLEQRLSVLAEKWESGSGIVGTHQKRRRCKNTKLAEAVRRFYNSDTNTSHYQPDQGLNSSHNLAVTSVLLQTLKANPDFQCVESCDIISACKTYFETLRRNYRYQQPDREAKAVSIKNLARSRQRRKRLLAARQSVIKDEERELWRGVTVDLMSDEEDGVSEGIFGWIVRRPSFRSQQLSDLCGVLQSRLGVCSKYAARHLRRLRYGAESDRLPPTSYSAEAARRHFVPEFMPQILI